MMKVNTGLKVVLSQFKWLGIVVLCALPSLALSAGGDPSSAQLQQIIDRLNLNPTELNDLAKQLDKSGARQTMDARALAAMASELSNALSGKNLSTEQQQALIQKMVSKLTNEQGISPDQLQRIKNTITPGQLQQLKSSLPEINGALQQLSKPDGARHNR